MCDRDKEEDVFYCTFYGDKLYDAHKDKSIFSLAGLPHHAGKFLSHISPSHLADGSEKPREGRGYICHPPPPTVSPCSLFSRGRR